MKLDEQVAEAVRAKIAEQILASLDTPARDAILAKAITDALTAYDFKKRVEQVAADKAAEVVGELLQSEAWTIKIRQAIVGGFEDYLKNLREALPKAMQKLVHGTEGDTYSRGGGRILADWPTKPQ